MVRLYMHYVLFPLFSYSHCQVLLWYRCYIQHLYTALNFLTSYYILHINLITEFWLLNICWWVLCRWVAGQIYLFLFWTCHSLHAIRRTSSEQFIFFSLTSKITWTKRQLFFLTGQLASPLCLKLTAKEWVLQVMRSRPF